MFSTLELTALLAVNNLILVVEDSDEDFAALGRVMRELKTDVSLHRACDGEEALDYLYHRGAYDNAELAPTPAIILLDLNLPGTDGRDVIKEIKRNARLKCIPIVVLTTSSSQKDIQACYDFGANSYLLKPMGFKKLKETIAVFCEYWLQTAQVPVIEN